MRMPLKFSATVVLLVALALIVAWNSPSTMGRGVLLAKPRQTVLSKETKASFFNRCLSNVAEGRTLQPGVPKWKDNATGISMDSLRKYLLETAAASHHDEIWYSFDSKGIRRSRGADFSHGLEKGRVRPTEAFLKRLWRYMQQQLGTAVKDVVGRTTTRWCALEHLVADDDNASSVFWSIPLRVRYGDYTGCDGFNWRENHSIPTFPVCMQVRCEHRLSLPNYNTIQDSWSSRRQARLWQTRNKLLFGASPWRRKIPKAVWRGTLNGNHDLEHSSRWLLTRLSASHSDLLDAGPIRVAPHLLKHASDPSLVANLTLVQSMTMSHFQRYQAIIDVDGNSWSSRFRKLLCYNSVVLKVEPEHVDCFHYQLTPWKHYIPVSSNLTDLLDAVRWVTDAQNAERVQAIVSASNKWCEAHLIRPSLLRDALDIFNDYVALLYLGDPHWQTKWQSTYRQLQTSRTWEPL